MAEIAGTVVPVLAEPDGVDPENVPGPVVEPGFVPAVVVGVTELEVVSVGRAVVEVEGVEVVEKLLLPLLPDKPEDPEELLPPSPEPDEPDPPAEGVEVVEKLLAPAPPGQARRPRRAAAAQP